MKSSGAAKSVIWSIGELAGRFGLETHVLRHWESEGLLDPERERSGYRGCRLKSAESFRHEEGPFQRARRTARHGAWRFR